MLTNYIKKEWLKHKRNERWNKIKKLLDTKKYEEIKKIIYIVIVVLVALIIVLFFTIALKDKQLKHDFGNDYYTNIPINK